MVNGLAPASQRPVGLLTLQYSPSTRTCRFGSLLAPQNAVDVARGEATLLDVIRTIGTEAACSGEVAIIINRRQPVPRGKCDDQIAMNDRRRAPGQYQRVSTWIVAALAAAV
jgi:hypothetical protein